jgi:hypothetical protein
MTMSDRVLFSVGGTALFFGLVAVALLCRI